MKGSCAVSDATCTYLGDYLSIKICKLPFYTSMSLSKGQILGHGFSCASLMFSAIDRITDHCSLLR
jgi:hypothetical protein